VSLLGARYVVSLLGACYASLLGAGRRPWLHMA
jgi:hypothetical protein